MTITEAIEKRKSTRTFIPEPLSPADRSALEQIIREAHAPWPGDTQILIADYGDPSRPVPSTYAVIRGARTYMLMFGEPDDDLHAGYLMESIVLGATALGLDTCWLGGTFKASDFLLPEGAVPRHGSTPRIVVPVGHHAGKMRFMERVTRAVAGSNKRLPPSRLFFDGTATDPLSHPLPAGTPFDEALAMMRLAPSSLNSQPWRAVVSEGRVDFYHTVDNQLTMIDMGIALSHFHLTLLSQGRQGRFFKDYRPLGTLTYLISFELTTDK